MFSAEDLVQITNRGSHPKQIEKQIDNFRNGFPFLRLTEAASNYHGIIKLSEEEVAHFIAVFEDKKQLGLDLLKFVPASGAASRMFKALFSALDNIKTGKPLAEIKEDKEVAYFFENLPKFAFFEDLNLNEAQIDDERKALQVLELVLTEKGLNYGELPKALIKFHRYGEERRTSLEEHFIEGALYSANAKNIVNIHFTVSPEHQKALEKFICEITPKYEKRYGVKYAVSFSNQKPSTDTVAVEIDNNLFRNKNGQLLFRPAGHGALLDNLNDLEADIIFIKNIDNVAPDHLKDSTVRFKKALGGALINLQEEIFGYQKILRSSNPEELDNGFYAELANFVENILLITPPAYLLNRTKKELFDYLSGKINRPVRVCGMVRNEGEPGGGPFFALNPDGSVSLQIVESSQINFSNQDQAVIARQASHFNPVDLICGIKDFEGRKFDLSKFTDPQTGLITIKSYDGKALKAQELPGLWNGSMSDWNTIFIEVPIETFSPVKTVNDLLRKEHQPR
ncbi:MAG TPA: DUF4301 family protein [Prolixibacteraceae bacterium]|nr:DUF4301 family protein [Prolixibacteraceae bacterium]